MQLSVIPMQLEHIGFVHSILSSPHNKAVLYPAETSLEDFEKSFTKNLADPDEKNFIVLNNALSGDPVAWIKLNGLTGKQAWLSMLIVREDCQHQGIGRFAVRYSEQVVQNAGFTSLGIHANADNSIARRCYEKLGYVLTEESECTNGDGQTRMGCTYMRELSPATA